jgi:hypothetical protein
MEFIIANKALIFGLLFALSEVLAAIPSVKANSVFQMVFGFIKQLVNPAA